MFAREYPTVPMRSPVIGFISATNTPMCDRSINRGTERIPDNVESPYKRVQKTSILSSKL